MNQVERTQLSRWAIAFFRPYTTPATTFARGLMLQTIWGCSRCWRSTSTTLSRNLWIFPRSLSSLTTVIISTTWLRNWKRCIPRSWRKSGLSVQRNPRNRKKRHKENLERVPAVARWVIERSNAWMERCKSLVKNFERTLAHATTKINLCFIRLMLKRLAATS